jgi:FMN phosphatase YigB (HAD superfamily)
MSIKAVVFDFGRVLIFPKDEGYFGGLNDLHNVLSASPNYKFLDNFEFNNELLDFLKAQKVQKGIEYYLFTKGKIVENPDCRAFLNGFFKDVYIADRTNFKKGDLNAYKQIIESIALPPEEILYIDDSRRDTAAAEKAGLQTITFRNNMQFETEFEGYL